MNDENDNQDSKPRKQYHPIDHAFFTAWLAAQRPLLTWALWFFNNVQLAQDMLEAAFQATVDGRRKWPTEISLERHIKDAMRSIYSNRKTSLSELQLDARIIEEHHGDDEELDTDTWCEPPLDLDMRNLEHLRTPEELYVDAEGTLLAERMAEEVFDMAAHGSLEQGILLEARNQNHKTADVAKALGVDPRKVQQAKHSLRIKVRAVLAKHGLTDPKLIKKAGRK